MMNSAATVAFGLPTSFCLESLRCHYRTWSRRKKRIPEQELAIQVTDVDGVHVDDMDILEARKSKVGQNLAPESTSADNEDLDSLPQPFLSLVDALVRLRVAC